MKKPNIFYFITLICYSVCAQSSWEEFTKIADSLDKKLQFEQALSYRAKAIESAKKERENTQKMLLGLQMFTQAEADFSKSKKANSEAYLLMQEAVTVLQIANASPERISKAYWDLNLAAFNYMRNQEDTERYLNKSIDYHLKSSEIDTLLLLNTMHGSSYMGILSGNYQKAITTLEQAIALFDQYQIKEEQDYNLVGYLYSNLALIYSIGFLDIPQKEKLYLNKAENAFSSISEPDLEYFIGTYTSLAKNERRYRNYKSAEGYLNKALQIYNNNKTEFHSGTMHYIGFKTELTIFGDLIIIYRDTGEQAKMLDVFNKVESIAKNNLLDQTEKNQYTEILRSLGRYYLNWEYDFDKVKSIIDKALKVKIDKTAIHTGGTRASLYLDLAKAHFLNKDYNQALKIINEIEETDSLEPYQIELKVESLLALDKIEEAIGTVNQLLKAISNENSKLHFPKSSTADFTSGYVITDAEGLANLAKAFRNYYGKYSIEEEKLYWMALRQFESNIGNIPLNKDLKQVVDKITSGLMTVGMYRNFSLEENNRLLNFMEVVASQEFINTFLLKREIAGSTELYKLIEEEQYVRSYLTFLKKEFLKSKDSDIKQQIFEKEVELKKINEKLLHQHKLSSLLTTPDIDVSVLPQKNIIKFRAIGDKLFKVIINNNKVSYQVIKDYLTLKQEIEYYLSLVNSLDVSINTIKEKGEALYAKLFEDDFNTTNPTVIISDDILHYLPFELLVNNSQYLIENHTISYVSSLYFLSISKTESNIPQNRKAVFFAPKYSGERTESQLAVRGETYALSGAEEEIKEIAKFIPGKLYLGDVASKTNFKALENDISILHLAMHSNLNNEDPELSNLIFSNFEEDYEMYISELYGLNFNADLAVLSACNTGVGGFKDGVNLVSMRQAFTTAGISSTVASLWNAPDQSTKEIMIAFYKNLQKGQDKAIALQQAKLNYLKNTKEEKLTHPFYWAGFVLSGDEKPVELDKSSSERNYKTILSAVLLSAGIILFLRMRRKKRVN
ncbi:CHAT domain-containing protein [Myroides indicus]|uniref:CHAT domain-containing protein n=1 Tax=Myroides indicus TaxID=1323422 RepID=A0A4V3E8D1_9FLAO|nr:CHAT domain-containing protein [Myroides indicus]TDS58145.1 CHAT domain-containing protein [Myroides indicus]